MSVQSFHCVLCQDNFPTVEEFNLHEKEDIHRTEFERRMDGTSIGLLLCKCCFVSVPDLKAWDEHIKSKGHVKLVTQSEFLGKKCVWSVPGIKMDDGSIKLCKDLEQLKESGWQDPKYIKKLNMSKLESDELIGMNCISLQSLRDNIPVYNCSLCKVDFHHNDRNHMLGRHHKINVIWNWEKKTADRISKGLDFPKPTTKAKAQAELSDVTTKIYKLEQACLNDKQYDLYLIMTGKKLPSEFGKKLASRRSLLPHPENSEEVEDKNSPIGSSGPPTKKHRDNTPLLTTQQNPIPQQQTPTPSQQSATPQQKTHTPQQQSATPQQQTQTPQQQSPTPQQQTHTPAQHSRQNSRRSSPAVQSNSAVSTAPTTKHAVVKGPSQGNLSARMPFNVHSGGIPPSSNPSGGIPLGIIPSGSIPSGSIPSGSIPPGGIPFGGIPPGGISAPTVPPMQVLPPGPIPAAPIQQTIRAMSISPALTPDPQKGLNQQGITQQGISKQGMLGFSHGGMPDRPVMQKKLPGAAAPSAGLPSFFSAIPAPEEEISPEILAEIELFDLMEELQMSGNFKPPPHILPSGVIKTPVSDTTDQLLDMLHVLGEGLLHYQTNKREIPVELPREEVKYITQTISDLGKLIHEEGQKEAAT